MDVEQLLTWLRRERDAARLLQERYPNAEIYVGMHTALSNTIAKVKKLQKDDRRKVKVKQ